MGSNSAPGMAMHMHTNSKNGKCKWTKSMAVLNAMPLTRFIILSTPLTLFKGREKAREGGEDDHPNDAFCLCWMFRPDSRFTAFLVFPMLLLKKSTCASFRFNERPPNPPYGWIEDRRIAVHSTWARHMETCTHTPMHFHAAPFPNQSRWNEYRGPHRLLDDFCVFEKQWRFKWWWWWWWWWSLGASTPCQPNSKIYRAVFLKLFIYLYFYDQ